ncbi:unnamed protein product, partial [Mesorhabditis belari]|uniref:Eukaryotic translation initiation factor 3 subunit A n=1 Tax=Mesorhabditis belari TaxID=2138241 RepID=A0AAF3E9B7_9BILA
MPPSFFQKPEAALKRAEELIRVGKEQDALETLHDTIKARRHKQWTQTHEEIMLKHVTLCVSLRKPHTAKDALFQYKTLTQQIAVTSLEKVITHFLSLAEQRTEEAQKISIEKVEEIDDLDQGDAPEHLLLSVVSGAAAQDRMDRTVLAPWLRFLWDSFRNCLELLRNNAQVEQLYHKITRQSLAFCAKFQRRTEFRKLSDLLRLHLNQIQKQQHLPHGVKLSSPESLVLMQDTRLCQLDTAIQMELWQEAYRSAEDVHGMMQLSKDKDRRMVKATSYVNYYDKLALVFWKAGNRLFHAAALLQKFIIYKDMKKSFTADEAQDQATRVLLATLSIPDGADSASDLTRHLDMEDHHLANIRLLSNLLKLPIAPTRSGILREAARLGVPELANAESSTLYRLLENNFAPNRLAYLTEVQLKKIESEKVEYSQYVDALRIVIATKTLKQISVIYDTISWARLRQVLPFFDELALEQFLVDVSKHRYVKANIDHRDNCIRFGGSSEATLAGSFDLEEADGFTGDDTQLGVGGIRVHLEQMHNKLREMVDWLDGDERRTKAIEQVRKLAGVYQHHKMADYERIQQRRRKIESYKETSERVKEQKYAEAVKEKYIQDERKRNEERIRLEQANKEQDIRRKQNEQEEVQRKIRTDKMKKLQQSSLYQAVLKNYTEEELATMDPEAVLKEQRARLDAERQEQQQRLQLQEKKFDHTIRAFHLEEMKERRALEDVRQQKAPRLFNEYEQRRVTTAIANHEESVKMWDRIKGVHEDAHDWIKNVKDRHVDDFDAKLREFEEKLDAVRLARLADRAEQRKTAKKREWVLKKMEEERIRKETEERQKQQVLEDQRRAARGERMDQRREREDAPSKAMADDDWRGGSRQPIQRPMPSTREAFPERGERQPMRERPMQQREQPASAADNDQSWRASMSRPMPQPHPSAQSGGPESDSRTGFYRPGAMQQRRNVERLNVERSNQPTESGVWTRGQVAATPTAGPADGAPQVPIQEKKQGYAPPHQRRRENDVMLNANAPANQPDSEGFVHVGHPKRPGPRPGPQNSQNEPPRRGPPPPRGGADSDNWRRN